MRKRRLDESLETSSALVGASIFCSLLVQRSFTQQSELASEITCWTTLPILFKLWDRSKKTHAGISGYSDIRPTSSILLWAIAVSLTISCVYKAENGMVELLPLLTPVLIIAERYLQSDVLGSKSLHQERCLLSPVIWGTTLCALVGTLSSSKWGTWGCILSILAVIPQLLVYIAFLPKDTQTSRQLPPLTDDRKTVENDLSWRIVAMSILAMSILTVIFGFSDPQIIRALLVGVAKAMSWFFLLRTRQHVSWCLAPAIQVFSLIASVDPFMQSSDSHAAFNVLTAGFALGQIIHMLPKQSKAKCGLWVFLLASLGPFLANLLAIRSSQSSVRQSFSSSVSEHPAETLANNAKASFEAMVQHQSKTYTAAYDEYQRRYSMEPPDGFEQWYNFATEHRSPIIDDFDTIYRSVSPFWTVSGAETIQIMNQAQGNPDIDLWSCTYSSAKAKARCSHPRRRYDRNISSLFNRLLGSLAVRLPDIKFLVNHLDEPRVLIPSRLSKGGNGLQNGAFILKELSHQPGWDELTRYCDKTPLDSPPIETFALPFVTNSSSAMDLCQHPEYETLHGMLLSPTSLRLIEGSVPVLSTGALSTMGDIVYPSPAYFEDEFQYDGAGDVDWEAKQNNLYWAGSTTGGYAVDNQWQNYQRQRFVSLAQNLEQKRHIYLQESGGVVKRVGSTFLNGRFFDVAFTKIFQCTMKCCRNQRMHFKTKPWADKYKAFRSKLAFDLDGNGISGRYYQLLASKSLPMKQTLIREWHDDRLIPWVHYVPVSQSMEELPELVSWLLSSQTGQQKAKQIAESGREWHSKAFREIDLSIYVYRLVLEIARLQDPKRQAREIDRK